MARQHIRFEQFFAAPCALLFRHFVDHERFDRLWWPTRNRAVASLLGTKA